MIPAHSRVASVALFVASLAGCAEPQPEDGEISTGAATAGAAPKKAFDWSTAVEEGRGPALTATIGKRLELAAASGESETGAMAGGVLVADRKAASGLPFICYAASADTHLTALEVGGPFSLAAVKAEPGFGSRVLRLQFTGKAKFSVVCVQGIRVVPTPAPFTYEDVRAALGTLVTLEAAK